MTLSRRTFVLTTAALPLAACETLDPALIESVLGSGPLTEGEAALGIRAALDNGIGNALTNLGRVDGFLGNDLVRIPLPQTLQDIQGVLRPLGLDGILVELRQQLNRGAEQAAPVARDIFLDAVRGLTIQDAIGIVRGPETAATDYLRDRTTGRLTTLFSPIMENALSNTGALRLIDDLDRQVPTALLTQSGQSLRSDLISHGVDFGLRGIFYFIGEEEKAIRSDPVARTSEILRRVFG